MVCCGKSISGSPLAPARCFALLGSCVCSAVASHPLLALKGWDPTRSAREVLLLLKQFLEVRRAAA